MRTLDIGTTDYTKVIAVDEPGVGGANHKYAVVPTDTDWEDIESEDAELFAIVEFQDGPIKEAGVNGCANEDLIAIVIDRLLGFQSGDFACTENANAIEHLRLALQHLRDRTNKRRARGIEGTSEI